MLSYAKEKERIGSGWEGNNNDNNNKITTKWQNFRTVVMGLEKNLTWLTHLILYVKNKSVFFFLFLTSQVAQQGIIMAAHSM